MLFCISFKFKDQVKYQTKLIICHIGESSHVVLFLLKYWVCLICRFRTVVYIHWRRNILLACVLLFMAWLKAIVAGRLNSLFCLCSSLVINCLCEESSLLDCALTLTWNFIVTSHLFIFYRFNNSGCVLSQIYDFFVENYSWFFISILSFFDIFLILLFFLFVCRIPFLRRHQVTFLWAIFVSYFYIIFMHVSQVFWRNFLWMLLIFITFRLVIDKILAMNLSVNKIVFLAIIVFDWKIFYVFGKGFRVNYLMVLNVMSVLGNILGGRNVFAGLKYLFLVLNWWIISFVLVLLNLLRFFKVLTAWWMTLVCLVQKRMQIWLIAVWSWTYMLCLCRARLVIFRRRYLRKFDLLIIQTLLLFFVLCGSF